MDMTDNVPCYSGAKRACTWTVQASQFRFLKANSIDSGTSPCLDLRACMEKPGETGMEKLEEAFFLLDRRGLSEGTLQALHAAPLPSLRASHLL